MTAPKPARIFISYATKDGGGAAADVRRDLEAQGFSVWQDIIALQGNADWWSQIENALRSKELEHFILIVTPGALASPVVRREIRLAKQEGKTISPVRGPGIDRLSELPRWLGNLYDLDIVDRRANLLQLLNQHGIAKRIPMMAPEPPADFVERPGEYGSLKKQLLDAKGDAVGITAALRGAGGYGKTTLAKALAHDPDIQDAYFDGVLWAELGEQGGARVLALISDLVALITGASRTMATIEAARTALAEALGERRILLVIDDVWQKHHLDPFLHGAKNTTRLVTTRFDRELPETAVRQPVDAMQASEALKLLSWGLPDDQVEPLAGKLAELAQKLHDWAQLLKLVNGFLRDRVMKFKQSLAKAIDEAVLRLVAKGLPAFDDPNARDYDGRHRSVSAAIGISIDLLETEKRTRFGELGVFPEDADIPVGIVARLWTLPGEPPDDFAASDLLAELYDLSLLLDLDLDRRTIRLHDTTRHFLQHQAGKAGLVAQHKRLIRAMGDIGGAVERASADNEYFYRFLLDHQAGAEDRDALDQLLLNPGWLQAKLAAIHTPLALVSDYDQYGIGRMQDLIGRTLRLTTGICARDQRQLLPQLVGRLMTYADPATPNFLASARFLIKPPALITQRPSLTPPGAETARLEGPFGGALAVLPDGRLASGGDDNTIRLWDLKTGAETQRLEVHEWPAPEGRVNALAVLPDGRLASRGDHNTIRLWDLKTGAETARLEGHSNSVGALVLLPDGRLASGAADNTIRLWDLKSGAETARLDGHSNLVVALVSLPDGRLASASYDSTIRLWDPKSGAETARLNGSGSLYALAMVPDGRLASTTRSTISLWDLQTSAETARIDCLHQTGALAVLPNGMLASGHHNGTVQLWNPITGVEIGRYVGHAGPVRQLVALPDGRLASGADDNTIRLWDLTTTSEATPLNPHTGRVSALAVLPDGRLASVGADDTIRLWDPKTSTEAARREVPHAGTLAVLPDGRLAVGASSTIELWDLKSGTETVLLEARRREKSGVIALAVLSDGRLASSEVEGTLRLWDVKSCTEICRHESLMDPQIALAVLADGRLASGDSFGYVSVRHVENLSETTVLNGGHDDWVNALVVLPDGRLASGARDNVIRLWDLQTGAESSLLEGHYGWVTALSVLPDGRLASGANDRTIRLWDPQTGDELTRLELDAAVTCLCALPNTERTGCHLVAGDSIGRLHWLEIVD